MTKGLSIVGVMLLLVVAGCSDAGPTPSRSASDKTLTRGFIGGDDNDDKGTEATAGTENDDNGGNASGNAASDGVHREIK